MAVVRSSRIVQAIDGLLRIAAAAWPDSVAGTTSRHAFDWVKGQTVAGRARLVGVLTIVASMTTLAMQRLSSRPAPLIWIVPSAFLLMGLCLLAVSRDRPAR